MSDVKIVVIDDRPSRLVQLIDAAEQRVGVSLEVLEPQNVTDRHLAGADLVSVDHYLGSEWDALLTSTVNPIPVSTQARNGIAVIAAIASRASDSESSTALTLHTSALDELGGGLPRVLREPLVAGQHDLDWVFRFDEENVLSFADQLLDFACDWSAARDKLTDGLSDFGAHLLSLPEAAPWTFAAQRQLATARPPFQDGARYTHGRGYFRWLSQRALPFPSFLVADAYAANLLGIDLDAFASSVEQGGLGAATEYAGPLASLMGRRWWVASIQQTLLDAGVDETDRAEDRVRAINKNLGLRLLPLQSEYPTVVVDSEGGVESIDIEQERTARISIDGWPSFAEEARVSIDTLVGDPGMQLLLPPGERRRISTELSGGA